jgi:hypothetical protein
MSSARILPVIAAAVLSVAAGLQWTAAADKPAAKPTDAKSPIKAIMKDGFKGDDSLFARVLGGKGSADDKAKLLGYAKELTKLEPPKGDAASWQTKTAALLKATDGVGENATAALPALKAAGDCKGCHTAHKPAPARK